MELTGVFAPIPTPIDDADAVAPAKLRAPFARWLRSPLSGFVALGSNGEAALLEEDESDRLIAAVREIVPSGRPLIVGAGRESTRATVAAATRAAALGGDFVLVRTPGFFKAQMTSQAFIDHYTAVADAAPVPVLLYNFTALTGVELPIDAVTALADHPNVVGMKESGGDLARMGRLLASKPAYFTLLAGSAATFHTAVSMGANGGILALACVLPEACSRLYELTIARRVDEAHALQQQLFPIAQLVGSVHGVAGLKAALKLVGCDVGPPRRPLRAVSPDAVAAITEALARVHEVAA
jgi:4-hydroxy-2-oxoglutarate aldolase